MTIGTVTDKKQPDNKYVEGDEVMNIYIVRVRWSFELQVGHLNQCTYKVDQCSEINKTFFHMSPQNY